MGPWTAPARDLSLRDASPMLAGQPRPTDAGSDRCGRRRGKFHLALPSLKMTATRTY
jgi:hypothetical protein